MPIRTSGGKRLGQLEFHPLTPERWRDFATLFGERGACGGCWCMWWRIPRREFVAKKGAANKRAMQRIVAGGAIPGILAYDAGQPIGWCAMEPRERFPQLERSRLLARVDEKPVWSIVCFFVARPYRRLGVSVQLLKASVDHARRHGARFIEGYPVEPRQATTADAFVWTGTAAAFRRAGFREVARRSPTRPIMRRRIRPPA